ncbi:DUF2125 domain-containing protein [Methylobacterium sp. J-090]|uniref:DUF2125 domain-containing protein n=1 Tax=Methylobacterium sp. J-090 TaxID=2836666 RepID=UPI001FB88BCD|nr:DUF2125 domain-containing protein [Methylobacterium sp. J-090]MCJ2081456.1 DUF2125 domain-containing protein [Methylobacterium sp. J-090]
MTTTKIPAATRAPSRKGLFVPFILLATLVVLWSAAWFWVRDRAAREMDAWLAAEAAAGRTWTCADRSIAGYPFRIELRCASLAFARADSRFTLGPVTAVVQVYQPRQGILKVAGPFHVEQGDLTGDVTWTALNASFHGASEGFVRASLAVDTLKGTVRGAGQPDIAFDAQHLEAHGRPTPGRFASDGAVDLSLRVAKAGVPLVDPFVGNTSAADIALDATVNRAATLRTGTVARELEAWRQAGGSLDIALLSLAKGDRRVQARGSLGLDAAHRPEGQIDLRAAGVEAIVGQVMGQRFGAEKGALIGNLVGQFLGGGRRARAEAAPDAATPGDPALKALPPLRLADGRLMLGPFPIPNVEIPPLY